MNFQILVLGTILAGAAPGFAAGDDLLGLAQKVREFSTIDRWQVSADVSQVVTNPEGPPLKVEGWFDSRGFKASDYHLKLKRSGPVEDYFEELQHDGKSVSYQYELNGDKMENVVAGISSEPVRLDNFKDISGYRFNIAGWVSPEGMSFDEFLAASLAIQNAAETGKGAIIENGRPRMEVSKTESDGETSINVTSTAMANEDEIQSVYSWTWEKDSGMAGLLKKESLTTTIRKKSSGELVSSSRVILEAQEFETLAAGGTKVKWPVAFTRVVEMNGEMKMKSEVRLKNLKLGSTDWNRSTTAEDIIPPDTDVVDKINGLTYKSAKEDRSK